MKFLVVSSDELTSLMTICKILRGLLSQGKVTLACAPLREVTHAEGKLG